MRRILLSTAAVALISGVGFAADPPAFEPAPILAPVPAAFNWTGFYVGGVVGYGWGEKDAFETEDPDEGDRYDVDGFLAGIEVGANWQINYLVLGLEGDLAWTGIEGDGLIDDDDPIETEIDFLATLTGRLGIAWSRALFYVEGGGAWVNEEHTLTDDGDSDSASHDQFGWLLGGGVEVAFNDRWSAKVEYNYMDFGDDTHDFDLDEEVEELEIEQTLQTVKFGINYRF